MITLSDVTFGYRRKTLFSGLRLGLQSGSIYGLLGKNGAGKTTLLKLMAGLLFPRTGTVCVAGETPRLRRPSFLEQLFVVPEEFELPPCTITQYAALYGKFYPRFSTLQLGALLQELEVDPAQKLHQMSFGQRKKAYIAFAIACNTPILLLDEPTNGLDIPSKTAFRRVVASVADEQRTVVISTHQVRDLDKLIDRIVILDGSEILLNASTAEITDKLLFTHLDEGAEALYAESTIHGRWGVQPNTAGAESPLDMELLFNATVTQKQQIRELFNPSNAQ